jgi:hypothetical protein
MRREQNGAGIGKVLEVAPALARIQLRIHIKGTRRPRV